MCSLRLVTSSLPRARPRRNGERCPSPAPARCVIAEPIPLLGRPQWLVPDDTPPPPPLADARRARSTPGAARLGQPLLEHFELKVAGAPCRRFQARRGLELGPICPTALTVLARAELKILSELVGHVTERLGGRPPSGSLVSDDSVVDGELVALVISAGCGRRRASGGRCRAPMRQSSRSPARTRPTALGWPPSPVATWASGQARAGAADACARTGCCSATGRSGVGDGPGSSASSGPTALALGHDLDLDRRARLVLYERDHRLLHSRDLWLGPRRPLARPGGRRRRRCRGRGSTGPAGRADVGYRQRHRADRAGIPRPRGARITHRRGGYRDRRARPSSSPGFRN